MPVYIFILTFGRRKHVFSHSSSLSTLTRGGTGRDCHEASTHDDSCQSVMKRAQMDRANRSQPAPSSRLTSIRVCRFSSCQAQPGACPPLHGGKRSPKTHLSRFYVALNCRLALMSRLYVKSETSNACCCDTMSNLGMGVVVKATAKAKRLKRVFKSHQLIIPS